MAYAFVLPAAYLLGSISWGLIVGKLARGVDVRQHGSGATGTTNVLRVLGPRLASVVLLADIAKGVVAVLLARWLVKAPMGEALAGTLVIIGHNWPAFSRFQGGRGTSPAFGALTVMSPLAGAAALGAFLPAVAISRYASLGSIASVVTAMVAVPALMAADMAPWHYLVYTMIGGPLILWRHWGNIQRLLKGTERRLSFGPRGSTRKSPPQSE